MCNREREREKMDKIMVEAPTFREHKENVKKNKPPLTITHYTNYNKRLKYSGDSARSNRVKDTSMTLLGTSLIFNPSTLLFN